MRTITTALATATVAALLTTAPAHAVEPRPPSRPGSVHFHGDGDQIGVAWLAPARTGSHPIRRYVIQWTGGRMVVPASTDEVIVGDLDPGHYVFRVKAVSRAGSSPWARSSAVHVL